MAFLELKTETELQNPYEYVFQLLEAGTSEDEIREILMDEMELQSSDVDIIFHTIQQQIQEYEEAFGTVYRLALSMYEETDMEVPQIKEALLQEDLDESLIDDVIAQLQQEIEDTQNAESFLNLVYERAYELVNGGASEEQVIEALKQEGLDQEDAETVLDDTIAKIETIKGISEFLFTNMKEGDWTDDELYDVLLEKGFDESLIQTAFKELYDALAQVEALENNVQQEGRTTDLISLARTLLDNGVSTQEVMDALVEQGINDSYAVEVVRKARKQKEQEEQIAREQREREAAEALAHSHSTPTYESEDNYPEEELAPQPSFRVGLIAVILGLIMSVFVYNNILLLVLAIGIVLFGGYKLWESYQQNQRNQNHS